MGSWLGDAEALACGYAWRRATLPAHPVAETDESEELRAAMIAYQRGDAAAFDRVYAGLAPRLRRYLLSLARDGARAEDLLQETFLRMHRARHTYDPSLPVGPWAYAIARHAFLMERRRATRARETPLGEHEAARDAAFDQAAVHPHEMARALARLPAERREAILLHHGHGFSFEEIARRLGIRAGAARVRAHRGIVALRALLGKRR